jgi:hypothetical protein
MEHRIEQRNRNIDFKSLVIGLLLGLCITLVSGASKDGGNGRYDCSADQDQVFIIDTQTGQTWRLDKSSTTDFGTPQNRKSEKTYVTPMG